MAVLGLASTQCTRCLWFHHQWTSLSYVGLQWTLTTSTYNLDRWMGMVEISILKYSNWISDAKVMKGQSVDSFSSSFLRRASTFDQVPKNCKKGGYEGLPQLVYPSPLRVHRVYCNVCHLNLYIPLNSSPTSLIQP